MTRELLRDGPPVPLAPKVFDSLALPIQHHERVVLKDELISGGPDGSVSEDSLTQNLSALRRALGDDPAEPRFIATIARRGYRFIAPVEAVAVAPAAESGAPAIPPEAAAPSPTPSAEAPTARDQASQPLAERSPLAPVLDCGRGHPADRCCNGRHRLGMPHGACASVPVCPAAFQRDLPVGTTLASGGVVSPDSKFRFFTAQDENSGKTQLWPRSLYSADAHPLPATERLTAVLVAG